MSSSILNNVVKMSAAGAGKTWDICHEALEMAHSGKRVLIVTYTTRGIASIKNEICGQNAGVLHEGVTIKTWFRFLLSDMIKPYQNFITGKEHINIIKSIDYGNELNGFNKFKSGNVRRYLTTGNNVKSNHVSELALYLSKHSQFRPIHRIEEIYSTIYFDEIQDMIGDDIELIELLMDSAVRVVCCGDNKQATFHTHNSKKNRHRTGKNIWKFFDDYGKHGKIEVQKNLVSRRFNQHICDFANSVFPVGDSITTMMDEKTVHDGVFLIARDDVADYYAHFHPQVLRYDINADTCGYQAVNFGACKGETFNRILIFPNRSFEDFILKGKPLGSPEKYYVAVTRPKYSIAIVLDNLPFFLEGYQPTVICGEGISIPSLQFMPNFEERKK